MRSSLKMQFVRLSFRLQSRDLRGPSPQLRRQQSRAGLRKLALCFVFLLWNALAQLCGSRGSLLNGPKELSSKPESSKCSPNTCGGRAELQLKGSRRQYRRLRYKLTAGKAGVPFSLELSPKPSSFPCCLNGRHVPHQLFIVAFAPQLHRRKNHKFQGKSKEQNKFPCTVYIIMTMILKKKLLGTHYKVRIELVTGPMFFRF